MFAHAWHRITRSDSHPPPYWFCAKCGERTTDTPQQIGCSVET